MQAPINDHSNNPKPPTNLANKFVRFLVGFSVGVAIGLAPYLGKLDLPLFTPLLTLIPFTIQDTVLPLSAALMGIIAVIVEWYGQERLTRRKMKKIFGRSLVIVLVSFLILVVVHTLLVVRVPVDGGEGAVSFLVGFERPLRPPCSVDVSDAECIKFLTFDPSRIVGFWGDKAIKLSKLTLMLSYLFFTSMFGYLVGILLLRTIDKHS